MEKDRYPDLVRLRESLIFSEYPTDQILKWSNQKQREFRDEVGAILENAYPEMADEELENWRSGFFKVYDKGSKRRVLLLRNSKSRLIGAALYNIGSVRLKGKHRRYVYLISITILSPYQGHGIGKAICTKILKESAPYLFLSSCTQTDMLHCCVSIVQNGTVSGYDVVPYLEIRGGTSTLVTVSQQKLPFVKEAFRQIYADLKFGNEAETERALANLSDTLVRKNMFGSRFAFAPWAKGERKDTLAQALGVNNNDGILIVITQQT